MMSTSLCATSTSERRRPTRPSGASHAIPFEMPGESAFAGAGTSWSGSRTVEPSRWSPAAFASSPLVRSSDRRAGKNGDETDHGGAEETPHDPSAEREEPDQRAREHRELPGLNERTAQRDRRTGDGADGGRARPGEERLRPMVLPDPVEVRAAGQHEDERRAERAQRGKEP